MDGSGACLLPLTEQSKEKTPEGIRINFDNVSRCNRLEVTGSPIGNYVVRAAIDHNSWAVVAEGAFENTGKSRTDHYRPAPYAPGVNVYDEGNFVEDGVIHTNEFFTKSILLEADGVTDVKPWHYGDIDDYCARKILQERFGEEKAEELLAVYQNCYLKEEDLDYIKSLGFNFIRVPIYWQELGTENGSVKQNAWENLDWVLEKCRERELYVMLDYHGAPGGNTLGSITAGQLDSNEFWNRKEYQELSLKIWVEISNRYKNHPEVAAYDLLNEPCAFPVSYGPMDMEGVGIPDKPVLYYVLPESVRKPVRDFYQSAYRAVRGK